MRTAPRTSVAGYTEMIRRHFDAGARRGDGFQTVDYSSSSSFRLRNELLCAWIGAVRDLDILDVGCGNGLMTEHLTSLNRVIGVDFSLGMLSAARRRGLVTVGATAERLPIATGSVDLCLAIEVGQYLPGLETMLLEMIRVTRPGGRLLVSGLADSWLRRIRAALRRPGPFNPCLHSPTGVESFLRDAGLSVTRRALWFQPTSIRLETSAGARLGALAGSSFAVLAEVPRP